MAPDLPWFFTNFEKPVSTLLDRDSQNVPSPFKANRELMNHLRARRIASGQEFILTNGRGQLGRCRLDDDGQTIHFQELLPVKKPPGRVRLLLPALEKNRLNPLIAQLTSLAVEAVFFYQSTYSQPRRVDPSRLQAISQAALTQCKRAQAIRFGPPHNLPLLKWLHAFERQGSATQARLILALPESPRLSNVPLDERPTYLLVGPEGGFAPEEYKRLVDLTAVYPARVQSVRLGPYILRAETAALALAAIVQGQFD